MPKIYNLLFSNIIIAQSFVSIEKITIFIFEFQTLFVFDLMLTFINENVFHENQIEKNYQIYFEIERNKNIAKIIKTIKDWKFDIIKQFILILIYNIYWRRIIKE